MPRTLYLIFLLVAGASALARDALVLEESGGPRTHLVSFRSCSEDSAKACNRKFFEELRNLSQRVSAIPSIRYHHMYQGLPPQLLRDPKWARHVVEGLPGRGYWFWKAAILNFLLRQGDVRDGDVFIWADADVKKFFYSEEDWRAWLAFNTLDVFVQLSKFCEAEWTKGDIWRRFKLPWSDERYGLTPQVHAQFFVLQVNARTRRFLQFWEDLVSDFHLVSNERSESPDPPVFKCNRHDQSLLSLLMKASIPEKPSWLGDCEAVAKQTGSELDGSYDRRLHPEFGIANLSAQIGDFGAEQFKAVKRMRAAGMEMQRKSAFRGAERRLCVQGSCYDLDELKGLPEEVEA